MTTGEQTPSGLLGRWLAAGSLLASFASVGADIVSGRCHAHLRRLRLAGEPPPEWPTWSTVDDFKRLSLVLAGLAVPLGVAALWRGARTIGVAAAVAALGSLMFALMVT